MLSLLGVAATSADVNVRPGLQSTTLACNIVQREYKASGCCPSSLILNPDKRMLSSSMCSFFQGLQPKPTPYRATVSNFTNTDFFTNEEKVSIIRDQKYIVQFIPMVADVMIDYSKGRICPLPNDSVPRISTDYNRSTPVTCYH